MVFLRQDQNRVFEFISDACILVLSTEPVKLTDVAIFSASIEGVFMSHAWRDVMAFDAHPMSRTPAEVVIQL